MTQFFLSLRDTGDTVRVQVHAHPREAWHSPTHDHFSLAPAKGFLSPVIPNFALAPASLAGTALVRVQRDGSWALADPEESFSID